MSEEEGAAEEDVTTTPEEEPPPEDEEPITDVTTVLDPLLEETGAPLLLLLLGRLVFPPVAPEDPERALEDTPVAPLLVPTTPEEPPLLVLPGLSSHRPSTHTRPPVQSSSAEQRAAGRQPVLHVANTTPEARANARQRVTGRERGMPWPP